MILCDLCKGVEPSGGSVALALAKASTAIHGSVGSAIALFTAEVEDGKVIFSLRSYSLLEKGLASMNNILKASAIFVAGMLSSSIAGFIYGWAGYGFDLFLVFPFIVAAFVISMSMYAAKALLYDDKKFLFVMGIVFGVTAYSMHIYGGYIAFEGTVRQGILQIPQNKNISQAELSIFTNKAISEILQRSVGITGPIGWLILRTKASITPFYDSNSNQGQGSYVAGVLVELFKLGCMTVVTGIALRDLTGPAINLEKDEAYQAMIKQQKQEKQVQKQAEAKSFRIVVAITLAIIFIPLVLFIISLYLY